MKTLLNKKYKFTTKRGILTYGNLNQDLIKFLKSLTLNDKHKYVINIFTDATPSIFDESSQFDFIDIDTYAPLYYEEISSFDGKNSALIESKINEIIDEMGEGLEKLNGEGRFYPDPGTKFYMKIYRIE